MTVPRTRKPLALTMGEPSGISGEVTLKAWTARRAAVRPFFVIDHPDRLAAEASTLGLTVPIATIGHPREAGAAFPEALPVLPLEHPVAAEWARPDTANAAAVIESIDRGVALVRGGDCAAVPSREKA